MAIPHFKIYCAQVLTHKTYKTIQKNIIQILRYKEKKETNNDA